MFKKLKVLRGKTATAADIEAAIAEFDIPDIGIAACHCVTGVAPIFC